ncbi:hypothetical protein [Lysobacter sp. CA199]|uniref:hypothetical protein n=1 Tax=Lysobacter sp. CA199 TaxID=3455608 RepID=UPI003F8D7127
MADGSITRQQAAAELLRRRRARESLVAYSQAITIPGAPMADDPDEWLFKPIETTVAAHHRLTMEAVERCIRKSMGRLMIFEPPGSAKSTYASVVAPSWAMGAFPGLRVLMTSYAGKPIIRHSKRARQIVASREYAAIWPDGSMSPNSPPPPSALLCNGSNASDEWELGNGSGLFAAGILGGITSSRCDLGIIDDPVAGRQEAESPTTPETTRRAYDDDFLTRLKPHASVILIQTRWSENDLAGGLLPKDYDGRSGIIRCRDGVDWEVLCIPAKAERLDDPLGRKVGEYLWPEYMPREHWAQHESKPRTWSSLYQQRPAPDSGIYFKRDWFEPYRYTRHELPKRLRFYLISDFAVTEEEIDNDPDYSEHGLWGVDAAGEWWAVGWWSGQVETDESIDAAFEFIEDKKRKPLRWIGEQGVIEKALGPHIRREMKKRRAYVNRTLLPSLEDKVAKSRAFAALAQAGVVHFPVDCPWADAVIDQLCKFPAGRYKDKVDVCGMAGRAADSIVNADPAPSASTTPEVNTLAWFEQQEEEEKRERVRY